MDTGLAAGRRFARRYLVERLVGRGGMGSVWAVVDADLGERVALKTLDRADSSEQTVERFRREVRLARRVTHRNVARIFDIGEAGGVHYLTMELVDGESLADRLHRAPPGVAEACRLAAQIAEGLAAAHAAEIVHRDLKPGNVLVDRNGRAVITDFGIACAVTGDVKLTVEGAGFLGTPAYMSPEQVRGDAVEAASDLYSLGVMLFELLTGRLPFHGDSTISLALARLHQAPDDPREHAAIDDSLAALVLQCLALDPADRPADASAVAQRLLELHPTLAVSAPASRPNPRPTTATTRIGSVATRTGTRPPDVSVAVLLFRYRGPAGEEYVAEALTDEIIDLLSRNRGLRVSARGATAKFGPEADPRAVGRELGVDVVVDGSVQRGGETIRISARLVAVDTGVQLWSERFDGRLVDVFELQDRLARQIAETLRVQLESASQRNEVPAEAVAMYMRARSLMRSYHMGGLGPDGAVGLLEQVLAQAPTFRPAIAALAVATERTWFSPATRGEVKWRERTVAAIEHALADAPELPETHLAAARLGMQRADYAAAAHSITRALSLAPTFAGAHEVLGSLQCEAGRPEEGLRHLRLAVALDPTLLTARMYEARHYEMHGRHAEADALMAEAEQHSARFEITVVATTARIAAWRGDLETVSRQRGKLLGAGNDGSLFDVLLQGYLGLTSLPEALANLRTLLHPDFGPRFVTLGKQLAIEALARVGEVDVAEELLAEAADGALVDLDWLDHCPMLVSLRGRPRFAELRAKVRARAEAIWVVE